MKTAFYFISGALALSGLSLGSPLTGSLRLQACFRHLGMMAHPDLESFDRTSIEPQSDGTISVLVYRFDGIGRPLDTKGTLVKRFVPEEGGYRIENYDLETGRRLENGFSLSPPLTTAQIFQENTIRNRRRNFQRAQERIDARLTVLAEEAAPFGMNRGDLIQAREVALERLEPIDEIDANDVAFALVVLHSPNLIPLIAEYQRLENHSKAHILEWLKGDDFNEASVSNERNHLRYFDVIRRAFRLLRQAHFEPELEAALSTLQAQLP